MFTNVCVVSCCHGVVIIYYEGILDFMENYNRFLGYAVKSDLTCIYVLQCSTVIITSIEDHI